jgi:hypothetical protein
VLRRGDDMKEFEMSGRHEHILQDSGYREVVGCAREEEEMYCRSKIRIIIITKRANLIAPSSFPPCVCLDSYTFAPL